MPKITSSTAASLLQRFAADSPKPRQQEIITKIWNAQKDNPAIGPVTVLDIGTVRDGTPGWRVLCGTRVKCVPATREPSGYATFVADDDGNLFSGRYFNGDHARQFAEHDFYGDVRNFYGDARR